MKNRPLISVIVPIYNVEDYLAQCIDSILVQSYENFELILVDDGSPDNCGIICDEYAKNDQRINVIHQKNGGLSDARNSGLNIAKGEYIAFVDSDDLVHPDFLQIMYQNIGHAELIFCDLNKFSEDDIIFKELKNEQRTIFEQKFIIENITSFKNPLIIVAWNKLYKKSIWQSIRYPKGRIHEDEFVVHEIINQCKEIVFIDEMLYFYRLREDSIMTSPTKLKKRKLDTAAAKEQRLEFFHKFGWNDAAEQEEISVLSAYFDVLRLVQYKELPLNIKDYFKNSYKDFSFKNKLKFLVFKYGKSLIKAKDLLKSSKIIK